MAQEVRYRRSRALADVLLPSERAAFQDVGHDRVEAASFACQDEDVTPVILPGMTHRVGRKGQVVIPRAFRKAIRLEPGDEVTFSQEGNALRLERVVSPDALMGRLAGHRLVEALEKDRQAERRR
jgi:AbrB family looped-hinge helix DNA binding protein